MATGLKRKLEADIEIRVKGGDAFHEVLLYNPHEISNIHPEFVQGCELHDGASVKPGSKITWNYTLDGKPQKATQIIDMIDEKNKTIAYRMLEGDLMEHYKTCVVIFQVIPKGDEKCLVKWIIEYEKKHPGVPEPTSLMDAELALTKQIDEHHHRQS